MEDQLVRSNLDKLSAEKMIDSLTDCKILRKEVDGTNVLYIVNLDKKKNIPCKKGKLDKLSIKQGSGEYPKNYYW